MTTTSKAESSTSTNVNTKRAIKRKLDDSILKKARAALGLPLDNQDDDEKETQSDEPSLKWRKPRHNTAEGQIYMKNKEKRKQEEMEFNQPSSSNSKKSVTKKEDKKSKKKRKKKKKVDGNTGAAAAADVGKNPESEKRHGMEAVSYLQLWSSNRDHWKFEKRKQTWLLKHCLNANLIDDKRFELLLEYMASIKGAARQSTLNEMQSIVKRKEMLGGGSEDNSVDESKMSVCEISEDMYDRARQIIQMLVD